jgi:hypothetical protein
MVQRQPGYYWIVWTDLADLDLRNCRAAPLIGEWDGRFWWFTRMEACKFDCEVEVIGRLLGPREQRPHLAEFTIDASQPAGTSAGSAPCP